MPEQLPIDIPPRPRLDARAGVTPATLWDTVLTARAALMPGSHPIPCALRDEQRLQRPACATSGHALSRTTHEEPAHGHSVR